MQAQDKEIETKDNNDDDDVTSAPQLRKQPQTQQQIPQAQLYKKITNR